MDLKAKTSVCWTCKEAVLPKFLSDQQEVLRELEEAVEIGRDRSDSASKQEEWQALMRPARSCGAAAARIVEGQKGQSGRGGRHYR